MICVEMQYWCLRHTCLLTSWTVVSVCHMTHNRLGEDVAVTIFSGRYLGVWGSKGGGEVGMCVGGCAPMCMFVCS